MGESSLNLFEELSKQYTYQTLVPDRCEGLVLIWLYEKIQEGEIDRNFTYSNIQEAINEVVVSIHLEHVPHTEGILKTLMHYYIERPHRSFERYSLTEYAKKFAKLLADKLNSPYRSFPLRKTFEKYAQFKAEEIKSIQDFESWFRLGFHETSKQAVIDHLETLKDGVRAAVHELNKILSFQNEKTALDMTLEFTSVFEKLSDKADEIRDTLILDIELNREIQKVIDAFYDQLEHCEQTNKAAVENCDDFEKAYRRAQDIKIEVENFFKVINEKLEQISDQIIFASTKLNELQEHFKYQSNFKVNIRKLLNLVLEEARYSRAGPILSTPFPLKVIPFEDSKLTEIPYYPSFIKSPNEIIDLVEDYEHMQKEKEKVDEGLDRQEQTAKLVRYYKDSLREGKMLNFTEHFYEILDEEGDIDIALQVGFELFQFANDDARYLVKVSRPLAEEIQKREVTIWKMSIHPR